MRYRGFLAIGAALVLAVSAAGSVDGGGKRTYLFDPGITSDTDCNVMMSFSWLNFPAKPGYTADVWVSYDSTSLWHWTEVDQAGTDTFTTQNFAFSGPLVTDTHYIRFTYSLNSQGAHARTVISGQVAVPTRCSSTLD